MSGAQDGAARPKTSPSSLRAAGEALLDGLLGSPRGGRHAAAAAAAAVADEEQPLLGSSPRQAAALRSPGPDERRPWPQLRGSSVSTRPFTPGLLAQELASQDDGWELDFDTASSPIPADRSSPGHSATHGDGSGSLDAAAGAVAAAAACGKLGGGSYQAAAAWHHHAHPRRRWRHARAMFAGLVDCSIALPLQTSFAAIIFRDPYFHPLLGSLVKLVFLSSALHQLTVVACSSMPYAVGQVQDVGLIFLSAIASAVVEQCSAEGVSPENTLATVLTAVTAATGVVGILLVCTGALKLARLVQYVPLPVMGGYLCFVGYFVLGSGVSLATGLQVGGSLQSWTQLAHPDALLKLAPALVLVALISLIMARTRSPFALPTLLVAAPAAFYAVLFATGHNLADARAAGWVGKPQPGDSEWRFWRAWSLYNIHDFPPSNIHWTALPGQLYKLLTLFFVVAFGSSMDIAAIQADASHQLDFNSELMNIGVSNLATAAAGVGFTGSYIFSQSLFMRRIGVESRVMGATLAAIFLAMFAAPANLLAFLPKFYFGGLTAWIGQDILKDWLLLASRRVSAVEYALLLTTFALVMGAGLEVGIGVGILLAALHFAYSYSRVTLTAFTVVPSRSGAVRTFDQRTVLNLFNDRITAVSLTGYIFFGSSLNVMETVMAIARSTLSSQPHTPVGPLPTTQPVAVGERWEADGQPGQAARSASMRSLPSSGILRRVHDNAQQVLDSARQTPSGAAGEGGGQRARCDARQGQLAAALADSPRFLILDFRRVQGLDATAARSFVALHSRLQHMGIQLIVTHLPARHAATNVRARLAAQGLVLHQPAPLASGCAELGTESDSRVPWFSTMDAACQYCEEHFLSAAVAHGLCPPPTRRMTLAQVLQANLELPRCVLGDVLDYPLAAALLQRYTSKEELRASQTLFTVGSPSDDIWLLESGCITCCVNFAAGTASSPAHLAALPPQLQPALTKRVVKYGVGSIVGDLDFFLQRPRSFTATVEAPGSAWRISRSSLEALAAKDPATLNVLQQLVLRSTCLSAAHALEVLDRVAHSI